ncbi:hypothetical protein BK5-Tp31 [Lactococcus phage BK5-T]|uniref:Uncharacterized protein n=1 Tax=Lactococcus phage BK5-T TaxID=31754 RepID=Q94M95_9CAUD|nr:hypothetical protein BK5-Tp31 [Lactococcus phage BK5-T]YP_010133251.1 hypothetical protein K3164_gp31 [Lactococcus phage BK5-T]AAK56824.1 unknown [Lactococcus phage BK5-T]CAC80172.1 hypothetical protein [Lactococcus phage BK5-T]
MSIFLTIKSFNSSTLNLSILKSINRNLLYSGTLLNDITSSIVDVLFKYGRYFFAKSLFALIEYVLTILSGKLLIRVLRLSTSCTKSLGILPQLSITPMCFL